MRQDSDAVRQLSPSPKPNRPTARELPHLAARCGGGSLNPSADAALVLVEDQPTAQATQKLQATAWIEATASVAKTLDASRRFSPSHTRATESHKKIQAAKKKFQTAMTLSPSTGTPASVESTPATDDAVHDDANAIESPPHSPLVRQERKFRKLPRGEAVQRVKPRPLVRHKTAQELPEVRL